MMVATSEKMSETTASATVSHQDLHQYLHQHQPLPALHIMLTALFFWRGFKFCHSKHKGVWNGYEVTCYHRDVAGLECRRRRIFAVHGGHDLTVRKLKAWCVAVSKPGLDTAVHHKAEPNDDDPPSPRTLDAIPVPDLPEDDGVLRRKRRRHA